MERDIALEQESARAGVNILEREIALEEKTEADQHVPELYKAAKNGDEEEGESGKAEEGTRARKSSRGGEQGRSLES